LEENADYFGEKKRNDKERRGVRQCGKKKDVKACGGENMRIHMVRVTKTLLAVTIVCGRGRGG